MSRDRTFIVKPDEPLETTIRNAMKYATSIVINDNEQVKHVSGPFKDATTGKLLFVAHIEKIERGNL